MKKILNTILLISFLSNYLIYSAEYYVSTTGDSLNLGTFDSPFLKVQQAADLMQSGDICYIRQGVYHENIKFDSKDGSSGSPIVFYAYNDERVVLDGTVPINSTWSIFNGNIWVAEIDYDIWQLFVDYQ